MAPEPTITFTAVLSTESPANVTNTNLVDVGGVCGANFCPSSNTAENSNLDKPSDDKIKLLSLIFLGCMAAAVILVALFLDTAKR